MVITRKRSGVKPKSRPAQRLTSFSRAWHPAFTVWTIGLRCFPTSGDIFLHKNEVEKNGLAKGNRVTFSIQVSGGVVATSKSVAKRLVGQQEQPATSSKCCSPGVPPKRNLLNFGDCRWNGWCQYPSVRKNGWGCVYIFGFDATKNGFDILWSEKVGIQKRCIYIFFSIILWIYRISQKGQEKGNSIKIWGHQWIVIFCATGIEHKFGNQGNPPLLSRKLQSDHHQFCEATE